MTTELLLQFIAAGVIIGILYALMAIGITFIYSIMKLINWAMGEFYMVGSFVQYVLVTTILGSGLWFLGIPLSLGAVFLLGVVVQYLLIKPMFDKGIERKTEYATIVTICLTLFLRSVAAGINGPFQRSPGHYIDKTFFGFLSGDRLIACIGALILMVVFYLILKRTWLGLALRGASQNRVGVQTAGVNLFRLDQLAFGLGVALAAGAGALLAPVFLVYPTNGAMTTMKGFEIIIIGGLGSIPGALIAGVSLGLIESLGAVFIDSRYQHIYGFIFLLLVLVIRPTGLFGERSREV